MGDLVDRDKFLVAGQCSVCGTTVIHNHEGVQMRFIPHDDPDWCRTAAASRIRSMYRAIDQAREERNIALEREVFFNHAYRIALEQLERNVGAIEPEFHSRHEWQDYIAKLVHEDVVAQRERRAIAALELQRMAVDAAAFGGKP